MRPQLLDLLRDDIAAVLRDNRPSPKRILIEKVGLDDWVGYLTPVNEQSPLVPAEPRAAHRPSSDWPAVNAEFARMCAEGLVDPSRRGWRTRTSKTLEMRFQATRPDQVEQGLAPEWGTIRKNLKDVFDRYQAQVKAG